jgi:hypothetical protein
MSDSAQFELNAISMGLIVQLNLDEFELSRSFFCFCFRSASKELNIDPSVWPGNQTATFEFASKRPLRDELLKDTQIPSIIRHSQQMEFFNANNAHAK